MIEREVIVPPGTARVTLTAPGDTIRAGTRTEFRAAAFDSTGAETLGAPIVVESLGEPMRTVADLEGKAIFAFDSAGTYTLVARFGSKADTLRRVVLSRRSP